MNCMYVTCVWYKCFFQVPPSSAVKHKNSRRSLFLHHVTTIQDLSCMISGDLSARAGMNHPWHEAVMLLHAIRCEELEEISCPGPSSSCGPHLPGIFSLC